MDGKMIDHKETIVICTCSGNEFRVLDEGCKIYSSRLISQTTLSHLIQAVMNLGPTESPGLMHRTRMIIEFQAVHSTTNPLIFLIQLKTRMTLPSGLIINPVKLTSKMISFKWFDPKAIVPKLYKIGLYTLTVQGCQTHIQVQLKTDAEKRLQLAIQDLFENYFDFEFKVNPGASWELEIDETILKKIGCKFALLSGFALQIDFR